ncbi:MAG: DUF5049 domain-containing protein [archaeon]
MSENDKKKLVKQYEFIRKEGKVNMFDKDNVKKLAIKNDFIELATFIEERDYSQLLDNYSDLVEEYIEE